MDINALITLVGSLGFPIVACIGMAWFFSKTNENYRNDIKEIQMNHKTEMDSIKEALNNNTLALQKLVDKLDHKEED